MKSYPNAVSADELTGCKPASVRKKRVCKQEGCDTILSQYNTSRYCNVHKAEHCNDKIDLTAIDINDYNI